MKKDFWRDINDEKVLIRKVNIGEAEAFANCIINLNKGYELVDTHLAFSQYGYAEEMVLVFKKTN